MKRGWKYGNLFAREGSKKFISWHVRPKSHQLVIILPSVVIYLNLSNLLIIRGVNYLQYNAITILTWLKLKL